MPGSDTRTEPTFGQIAVRHGFATAAQVNECVLVQNEERKAGREPRHLGQIMMEKGYLSHDKVQEVIRITSQERGLPAIQIPGYQILAKLGQGGMGAVYKARQVSMDRMVALKLLPARLARDKNYIDRFYQEARAAGRLNHENIVRAFDVGEAGGLHFFSMEFIEGDNVQSMLRKQKHLDEKLVLNVSLQIARALDHAHKHSLVHRDIKPENIMITVDGVAKLCDLGLAKDTSGDSSLTQVGTCVGTPHYIAPEQARGEQDIDIRADIYSLGASMFHMLIGEPVFNGPSPAVVMTKHLTDPVPPPHTLRQGISQAAGNIILKCMAKEREGRYQSPTEMIADIESALAGGSVSQATVAKSAPPKTGNTRRMKDTRHERAVSAPGGRAPSSPIGMIAGIAAVAVIGVVVLVMARKDKDTPPAAVPPKAGVEPGPANPAPPVAVGPTQAEEDKAKEGLDIVEAFRKENEKDPSRFGDVVQMYVDFLQHKEFKFTKWAVEAKKRLEEFKKQVEQEAERLLEPVAKKAEALAAEGRLLDAARAFDEFPPELAFTEAGGSAVQARDGYLRIAREKVENGLREAERLGADRKFEQANKLLEGLRPLCDGPQVAAINDLISKIEEARQTWERGLAANATQAYGQVRKTVHKLLRERKFEDARRELKKGQESPVLAPRAEELAHDWEETGLLEATYGEAMEGAKKLARENKGISLARFKGPVKLAIDGDEVFVRVESARTPLRPDLLTPSETIDLAGKVLDPADPVTHFKYGLVCFFCIDPESPPKPKDETLAKARTELEAARKNDPRAERYCRWLEDIANAAQIGDASKLYQEAKESFSAQRWNEAQEKMKLLLEKHGKLSFVQDRKDEIESMLKTIAAKLEEGKKVAAGIFVVEPKVLSSDGRIDITYDFEDEAQGKDWEADTVWDAGPPAQGSFAVVEEYGEAKGRGHKSFYWKGKLTGDFIIEFTLIAEETRNLGLQFCDDRRGRFYRATLGYQPVELLRPPWGGPDLDRALKDLLQPKTSSIVRVDFPVIQEIAEKRDWRGGGQRLKEEGHRTLGGVDAPEIVQDGKYVVRVARVKDAIEYRVNRSVIAEVKDGTYKDGYIALWCDVEPPFPEYPSAGWDDVHIQGRLDPAWLQKATEKGR